MTYEVLWVERKNDGWFIASLKEVVEGGQTYSDVSINRVSKKGEVFPEFDTIAPGSVIAGNIWQSPTSQKWSLFPPDVPKAAPKAPSSAPYRAGVAGIKVAQERKAEGIAVAQENKGKAILVAAAFRDSTLIVVNSPEYPNMSFEEAKAFHKRVRDWYIAEYKATEKSQDTPF